MFFFFLPFKQVHLHIIHISEIQTSKKCMVNVNNHLSGKVEFTSQSLQKQTHSLHTILCDLQPEIN